MLRNRGGFPPKGTVRDRASASRNREKENCDVVHSETLQNRPIPNLNSEFNRPRRNNCKNQSQPNSSYGDLTIQNLKTPRKYPSRNREKVNCDVVHSETLQNIPSLNSEFNRPRPNNSKNQSQPNSSNADLTIQNLKTPRKYPSRNREKVNCDVNFHSETLQNIPSLKLEFNKPRRNNRNNQSQPNSSYADLTFRNLKTTRKYPLGYKALKEISIREPDDIVLELLRENSGFKLLLLDSNTNTPDKVCLLFKVLSKACKSSFNKEKLLELLSLTFCKPFINMFSKFLIKIQTLGDQPIKEFFINLFEICFLFQDSCPFESVDSLQDIMDATLLFLKDSKYESEIAKCMELRNKVEESRQIFIDQTGNDKKEIKLLTLKFTSISIDEPRDDFRQISVLPTAADICQDELPILRKNLIEGKYEDPYHYLDIQFRLLREDFIRPLREGLSHFREQIGRKGQLRNRDLNIYKQIQVANTELVDGEFVYYVKLNLPRHFKMEFSKRLLSGNLVCFSKDRFQTTVFGYVFDASIFKLRRGIIGVKFESKVIDFEGTYDMAESRAYFVAYQHVLEALQNIKDNELPFSHYLLDVSNDIHSPNYFSSKLDYDLRVVRDFNLMNKLESIEFYKIESHYPPVNFFPQLASIKVSNPLHLWPSAELLSLDESQRAALHGALTRQMAIIQGPPGTGKTFLGLKVTQILLHNSDKWGEGNPGPILVVCCTNHALDQFLEGMIQFTSSIVRVGAMSKSDILSKFKIRNLGQLRKVRDLTPRSVYEGKSELNSEIQGLEANIDELLRLLKELKDPKGIFSYDTLRKAIPPEFARVLANVGVENWVLDIGLSFHCNNDNLLYGYKPFVNLQPSVFSDLSSSCEDDSLLVDQEEDEDEDVKEYLEQEQTNRMIALDVSIPRKMIKFPVNVERFYDSTIKTLKMNISELEYYINNEMNENDVELYYLHDFWSKKLQMISICLSHQPNMRKVQLNPRYFSDPAFVMRLSVPERWQHYYSWIEKRITLISRKLPTLVAQNQRNYKELEEIRRQKRLFIMRNSAVVGMTTTGAAKFSKVLKALSPKIVIVEEAAEILESHVVTSLTSKCQHLILIGDHQQLRPSTTVHELAVKYKLETSLFERMIINGVRYETLEFQHRMRPSISKLLVPNIYPSLKDNKSVHGREHIKGVTKDIYFIDHEFYEDKDFDDDTSHENAHEANLIMALCRHLLLQGYDHDKITVLTAYTGQLFLLKKIQKEFPVCASVKICVVDNFQGEENDIILLSLVRSNAQGNVGFLKIDNRVCVALSRAKNGFYITGNMNQLSSKSELWKNINKTLSDQGCIGPSIELKCENHPESLMQVSSRQQIMQRSPEGGCLLQCSFHYESCGHPCPRTCHAWDMEHIQHKCMKPCLRKLCSKGLHEDLCAKECWEPCEPCRNPVEQILPCGHTHALECHIDPAIFQCPTEVEREIPDCQHVNKMPCHIEATDCICTHSCDTKLDCGHQCRLLCHQKDDPIHEEYLCKEKCSLTNEDCIFNHPCLKLCYEECGLCMTLVEKILPCGHRHNDVRCHLKPEEFKCSKVCAKVMPCGHICAKKCYKPCGDCEKMVEKLIPECGHKVKMACGKDPKKDFCEENCLLKLSCGHNCKATCKEPCTTACTELVLSRYRCPQNHQVHVQCHALIKEQEAGLWCTEKCNGQLSCGHICKGKCGDCFNGRVHMPCDEPCRKPLVCGHVCKSPCSVDCPPCQDNCEFRCEHSHCRKKCAVPCYPCQKPCSWKCPHKICKERCGNICSRDACAEPCPEVLKCKHPCIGFCGDPCPQLCRICDHEKLMDLTHPGLVGEDTRYVMLEDCQHVIEVTALEQWLNIDNIEVGMKRCPRCKKGIFNSRRYNPIIKATYEDVNKVKFKYFLHENSTTLKKEIAAILKATKISNLINTYYSSECNLLLKSVGMDHLPIATNRNEKHFSTAEYGLVLFKAKTLEKGATILNDLRSIRFKGESNSDTVRKLLRVLVRRVLNIHHRVSSHLAEEVISELQRISILPYIFMIQSQKACYNRVASVYSQLEALMDPTTTFDSKCEEKVRVLLKGVPMIIGRIRFSGNKRIMIPQAMTFAQGHWYKCPNGHVNCLTECGGAMQASRLCPDCSATIGDANHQLQRIRKIENGRE